MECGSDRQGTDLPHHRGPMQHLALASLISSILFCVSSPEPIEAAVYECLDAAGKTVITNRQSDLHNCRLLSEGADQTVTPPAPSVTPQVSPPALSPDSPPAPPLVPPVIPPVRQPDTRSSLPGLPPPVSAPGMSPAPAQPCSSGLNPLNPLTGPPCATLDQSGTKPSGAAPAPPQ